MLSFGFSVLFVIFFVLTLVLRYWLASRHIRHVLRHRERVPDEFAEKIPLDAHQKAADYTVAKTRFGLLHAIWSGVVLIGFTLMGGLQALSTVLLPTVFVVPVKTTVPVLVEGVPAVPAHAAAEKLVCESVNARVLAPVAVITTVSLSDVEVPVDEQELQVPT